MVEQLDPGTFTGAHPTTVEFVAQLDAWGFRERPAKRRRGRDLHHQLFRGPHGGMLRVPRSRLGRVDPDLAQKAARLVAVDVRRFWAGPATETGADTAIEADTGSGTAGDAVLVGAADATGGPGAGTGTDSAGRAGSAEDAPLVDDASPLQGGQEIGQVIGPGTRERRRPGAGPARDQITSLVLAAHTSTDRPLGFDQVVALCRGRVTRDQVRTASATLCRDGHLDRIRTAVYQWSGGQRATVVPPPTASAPPAAQPAAAPLLTRPRSTRTADGVAHDPPAHATRPTAPGAPPSPADLFELLFPGGVQMNGELLADFERWAELTTKLTAHSRRQAS